jgi:hypothetical protein
MTARQQTPRHERELLRTILQTKGLLRAGIHRPKASRAYEAARSRFTILQLTQHVLIAVSNANWGKPSINMSCTARNLCAEAAGAGQRVKGLASWAWSAPPSRSCYSAVYRKARGRWLAMTIPT